MLLLVEYIFEGKDVFPKQKESQLKRHLWILSYIWCGLSALSQKKTPLPKKTHILTRKTEICRKYAGIPLKRWVNLYFSMLVFRYYCFNSWFSIVYDHMINGWLLELVDWYQSFFGVLITNRHSITNNVNNEIKINYKMQILNKKQ